MSEHPFRVGQDLYRYEDYIDFSCSSYDDDRISEDGGRVKARCIEGRIERLTPKGAHASFPWCEVRWVSVTGRKRYAYPTRAEAWESFRARKGAQCRHLRRQLLRAEAAMALPQPNEQHPFEVAVRLPRPELTPEQEARLLDDLDLPAETP